MNPFLNQILERWSTMQARPQFGGAPNVRPWREGPGRQTSTDTPLGPSISQLVQGQSDEFRLNGTMGQNISSDQFLRANGFNPSTIQQAVQKIRGQRGMTASTVLPPPNGGARPQQSSTLSPYNPQNASPFGSQSFRPWGQNEGGMAAFGNPRSYARTS